MLERQKSMVLAAVVVIALATQGVAPVIQDRVIARLSESVFGLLVSWSSPPAGGAPVTVIEVDQKTRDRLGWPIDLRHYAGLLRRFAAQGHPWVLSYLWFQRRVGEDQAEELLADAVRDYGRYVSTALDEDPDGALPEDFVASAVGRIAAVRPGVDFSGLLENMPLTLGESPRIAAAAARIGLPNRFSAEGVVHCMPVVVGDRARSGDFGLISGIAWAVSGAAGRPLALTSGLVAAASDPASGAASATPLRLADKACVTATKLTTRQYLEARGIDTVSMADALEDPGRDYTGHLVILAADDMRRVRGPGWGAGDDTGVVPEHLLAARFADGLMAGRFVSRDLDAAWPAFDWLPLLAGLLFGAGLYGLRLGVLTGVAVATWVLTAGLSIILIFWSGSMVVPTRFLLATMAFAGLLSAWAVWREVSWFKFERRMIGRLREGWIQANSLDILRDHLQQVVSGLFGGRGLMQVAVAFPEAPAAEAALDFAVSRAGVVPARTGLNAVLNRKVDLEAAIQIRAGQTTVGDVAVRAAIKADEEPYYDRLLQALGSEARLHWSRINMHLRQLESERQRVSLERELELGHTVQSLLLPGERLGRLGGWEFVVRFDPHGPMAGDWFQVVRFEGGAAAEYSGLVAIGDVVGKGTSAALITSAIAGEFSRSGRWARAGRPEAEALVMDVDQMVRQLFKRQQNTTMSLALLGADRAWVTCLAAPRWLHVRGPGQVAQVRTRASNPLGIGAKPASADLVEVPVAPGEMLVAHTDGVVDCYAARDLFESALRSLDPRRTLAELMPEIDAAAESAAAANPVPDDRTLLVLRRL